MGENTILLVEDNPDDIELTLRAFNKSTLDISIVTVRDGVEALDYLFGQGVYQGRDTRMMPDFILLDLKLPKLSGLEVLERIRADERTATLPVIILTSSDEENDLLRSYALHANSYIRKPVNFQQFIETVQQLGLYWLVLNMPAPKK